MEKTITIAGAGMGSMDGMTEELLKEAEGAELIIGTERILRPFANRGKKVLQEYRAEEIRRIVDQAPEQKILILVTGDQGFYSAGPKITNQLSSYHLRILPGISSIAHFSAVTGIPYSGAALISAHGRQVNIVSVVRRNRITFVLAGDNLSSMLKRLCDYGYADLEIYTGENLSAENERIRHNTARELLKQSEQDPFSMLSLMVILHQEARENTQVGIPDEDFIQGAVPMTKREVRALIISSLNLKADSVVVDIGAGTGSVSVEAALSAYKGTVYAVERKVEAQKLIAANAKQFHTDNIRIIGGEAPGALSDLPLADAYYIGGSGGRLREILEEIREAGKERMVSEDLGCDVLNQNERNRKNLRIVISAVTLQTLAEVQHLQEEMAFQNVSVTQIQAARSHKMGRYDLMKAENPVFVITADL